MTCHRCGEKTVVHSMSWFNTQDICVSCQQDEQACPNYALAKQMEQTAVRQGDYHFPGIGLAAEDRAALAARLAIRTQEQTP